MDLVDFDFIFLLARHTVDDLGIEWPGLVIFRCVLFHNTLICASFITATTSALCPSGVKKGLADDQTDLSYNEYVVYDEARIVSVFVTFQLYFSEIYFFLLFRTCTESSLCRAVAISFH